MEGGRGIGRDSKGKRGMKRRGKGEEKGCGRKTGGGRAGKRD
jgi:hypothetical protein